MYGWSSGSCSDTTDFELYGLSSPVLSILLQTKTDSSSVGYKQYTANDHCKITAEGVHIISGGGLDLNLPTCKYFCGSLSVIAKWRRASAAILSISKHVLTVRAWHGLMCSRLSDIESRDSPLPLDLRMYESKAGLAALYSAQTFLCLRRLSCL